MLRRRAQGAAAPSYAQAAARRSAPAAAAAAQGTAPAGARQAADAVGDAAGSAGAGGEHKLRFSLGSVQLSQSSTIFQAIQSGQRSRQAAAGSAAGDGEEAPPALQARRLWDEVHTVHFCRCAALGPSRSRRRSVPEPLKHLGELLCVWLLTCSSAGTLCMEPHTRCAGACRYENPGEAGSSGAAPAAQAAASGEGPREALAGGRLGASPLGELLEVRLPSQLEGSDQMREVLTVLKLLEALRR